MDVHNGDTKFRVLNVKNVVSRCNESEREEKVREENRERGTEKER